MDIQEGQLPSDLLCSLCFSCPNLMDAVHHDQGRRKESVRLFPPKSTLGLGSLSPHERFTRTSCPPTNLFRLSPCGCALTVFRSLDQICIRLSPNGSSIHGGAG